MNRIAAVLLLALAGCGDSGNAVTESSASVPTAKIVQPEKWLHDFPGLLDLSDDDRGRIAAKLSQYLEGVSVVTLAGYQLQPGNRLYICRDSTGNVWTVQTKLAGSGLIFENQSP